MGQRKFAADATRCCFCRLTLIWLLLWLMLFLMLLLLILLLFLALDFSPDLLDFKLLYSLIIG